MIDYFYSAVIAIVQVRCSKANIKCNTLVRIETWYFGGPLTCRPWVCKRVPSVQLQLHWNECNVNSCSYRLAAALKCLGKAYHIIFISKRKSDLLLIFFTRAWSFCERQTWCWFLLILSCSCDPLLFTVHQFHCVLSILYRLFFLISASSYTANLRLNSKRKPVMLSEAIP